MSSGASEIVTEPLLFSWDSSRQQKAVLAIFVVMSLVGHAFCFYVFQIVYPTPVALLPPPAGVTFITPDSEQGRTLLRWIDAEDPALAFTTHPPPQTKVDAVCGGGWVVKASAGSYIDPTKQVLPCSESGVINVTPAGGGSSATGVG